MYNVCNKCMVQVHHLSSADNLLVSYLSLIIMILTYMQLTHISLVR